MGVFLCDFSFYRIKAEGMGVWKFHKQEDLIMDARKLNRQETYKKKMKNDKGSNLALRISVISIVVNVLLSMIKFLAGIFGNSSAMISDAVHSVSDVFSTFVVIAGIQMANKRADKEHPYGHERMECAAAVLLAVFLGLVGIGIGTGGVRKIAAADDASLEIPGLLAMAAAVLSIGVKEFMFWLTRTVAKRVNSGALMADAWHHRSDSLSSVGSFVGILFARMGFPVMDSVASVVISICIVKASYDILKDGFDKMVDHSCDAETEDEIRKVALSIEGVQGISGLKTRLFGSKIYVDMEIQVDGEMKLREAHAIAEQVHDAIERMFMECKHCMVHVDPVKFL